MELDLKSNIELYVVKHSKRTLIASFPKVIESCNVSFNNDYLVYTHNWGLYKYNLLSQYERPIETEKYNLSFINNDHLIDKHGNIYLSAGKNEEISSHIYKLDIRKDKLTRLTNQPLSYLHGLSNKYILYTGQRNRKFDIFIKEKNHKEINLTKGLGFNDAPEFFDNDKKIIFNSDRNGTSQIYTMNIDGSNIQQLTFDNEYNCWFPHVSPNNKYVCYISYDSLNTPSNLHPSNKQISIHLMNIDGSESRVIANIYGGAGTMNVNSWTSDSKYFVFISYEKLLKDFANNPINCRLF
ncbi:MAG: hypothetical protein LBM99_03845 [Bacillales bacterium]|jgi:Tol biopolymer transport system component|nr:hypothetical protein [Bacillales bacterium]